jgi:uncharacterized damage-inducible protein DinB
LLKSGVAVEKLLPAKFAKIKLRQDAPQSIYSGRLYIFYTPNFGCLGRKVSFSTATGDVTQNRDFSPAIEASRRSSNVCGGRRLNGLGMARRRSVAIKSPKEIISLGGTVQIKLAGAILLWSLMSVSVSFAQQEPDLFQGYEGEWNHVSAQLISLAEATPPEKFTWRPASGVRSTSEVYMHIVRANFLMLNAIGSKMPADLTASMGTTVTSKPDVIRWLKRSLDAVKEARTAETPADLQRKTKFFTTDTTVDGVFLRIIVHNNEHMGQLVAYARMTGVVPPWSS